MSARLRRTEMAARPLVSNRTGRSPKPSRAALVAGSVGIRRRLRARCSLSPGSDLLKAHDLAPGQGACTARRAVSRGFRYRGYNFSTGKTTLVVLFNTVLTDHNLPKQ